MNLSYWDGSEDMQTQTNGDNIPGWHKVSEYDRSHVSQCPAKYKEAVISQAVALDGSVEQNGQKQSSYSGMFLA